MKRVKIAAAFLFCMLLAACGSAGTSAPSDSVAEAAASVKPSAGTAQSGSQDISDSELPGTWSYTWNQKDEQGEEWECISSITFEKDGTFHYAVGLVDSDVAAFVGGTYEVNENDEIEMHFDEVRLGGEENGGSNSASGGEVFVYAADYGKDSIALSCDAKDQYLWWNNPLLTMGTHTRTED